MSDTATPPEVFTPEFMLDPHGEIARLRNRDPAPLTSSTWRCGWSRATTTSSGSLSDSDLATPDKRVWEFYEPAPRRELQPLARGQQPAGSRTRRPPPGAPPRLRRLHPEGHCAHGGPHSRGGCPLCHPASVGAPGWSTSWPEFTDPIPDDRHQPNHRHPSGRRRRAAFSSAGPGRDRQCACRSRPRRRTTRPNRPCSSCPPGSARWPPSAQAEPQDDLISDLVTTPTTWATR